MLPKGAQPWGRGRLSPQPWAIRAGEDRPEQLQESPSSLLQRQCMPAWGKLSTTYPHDGPKEKGKLNPLPIWRMHGQVLLACHISCSVLARIPRREGPECHPPLTSSSQSWPTRFCAFSGHSANKHLCRHTEKSSASLFLHASQLFLSHLQWKTETSYTKKQWSFNLTHSWSEFLCSQAPNPGSCWDSDTLPPATQYPGPGLCVTSRRRDLMGSKDAASTSYAGKQRVSGKAGRSEQCQFGRAHEILSRDSRGNGTSNYKVTMENNVPCSTCKSWLSRKQLIIWATLIFSSG